MMVYQPGGGESDTGGYYYDDGQPDPGVADASQPYIQVWQNWGGGGESDTGGGGGYVQARNPAYDWATEDAKQNAWLASPEGQAWKAADDANQAAHSNHQGGGFFSNMWHDISHNPVALASLAAITAGAASPLLAGLGAGEVAGGAGSLLDFGGAAEAGTGALAGAAPEAASIAAPAFTADMLTSTAPGMASGSFLDPLAGVSLPAAPEAMTVDSILSAPSLTSSLGGTGLSSVLGSQGLYGVNNLADATAALSGAGGLNMTDVANALKPIAKPILNKILGGGTGGTGGNTAPSGNGTGTVPKGGFPTEQSVPGSAKQGQYAFLPPAQQQLLSTNLASIFGPRG